jgi:hypothetical protein
LEAKEVIDGKIVGARSGLVGGREFRGIGVEAGKGFCNSFVDEACGREIGSKNIRTCVVL